MTYKTHGGRSGTVVERMLNNNIVISRNSEGKETILRGREIGFDKRKRDSIVSTQIECIFTPSGKNETKRFQSFFAELPDEYWEIVGQMTHYAREVYKPKASEHVLILVCNHLTGAVERYQLGIVLKNPTLWEVKHLYLKEYQVGCRGPELMKKRFYIQVEPGEAAFLVFHYVCSRFGGSQVENLEAITRLIEEITQIVEACYQIRMDEESWNYQRFTTHLKFFAKRVFEGKRCAGSEGEWFHLIREGYPQSYKCIVKIADFIHDVYHYELNREEILCLVIHIKKITRQ